MFRNTFFFPAMLILTGLAIVLTPSPSHAQRGGGHGGGGHFGGGHFGGAHFGGGGHFDGFNHGGYHSYSGYRPYYHSYGYHPYYDYGHRYRSYYGYPYFYGYGAYPYSNYPDYSYSSAYPDYGSYYDSYPDYGYGAYPSYDNSTLYSAPTTSVLPSVSAPAQPDMTARVTVQVPPDADLWFEGTKTSATGPLREFQSPALASGHKYTYTIRARWLENGKEVTQTQQVGVTAGADVRVDFPLPQSTAKPTPATN